jgi:hypothetical protein
MIKQTRNDGTSIARTGQAVNTDPTYDILTHKMY